MRFIPDGPSIPDDLLIARDAGQVLFFCGAGVSQAEAGLPNFAKLAEDVLALLGSAQGSPARQLFNTARKFEQESGLSGLVVKQRAKLTRLGVKTASKSYHPEVCKAPTICNCWSSRIVRDGHNSRDQATSFGKQRKH